MWNQNDSGKNIKLTFIIINIRQTLKHLIIRIYKNIFDLRSGSGSPHLSWEADDCDRDDRRRCHGDEDDPGVVERGDGAHHVGDAEGHQNLQPQHAVCFIFACSLTTFVLLAVYISKYSAHLRERCHDSVTCIVQIISFLLIFFFKKQWNLFAFFQL